MYLPLYNDIGMHYMYMYCIAAYSVALLSFCCLSNLVMNQNRNVYLHYM